MCVGSPTAGAWSSFQRRPDDEFETDRFRSSFRDWAAERTNTPREVVEAALAHTVQNPTEAAYARSDLFERRRRLMDVWAAYLNGQPKSDTHTVADPGP